MKRVLSIPILAILLLIIITIPQTVEATHYYMGDTPTGYQIYLDDERITKNPKIIWADLDLVLVKGKKPAKLLKVSFFNLENRETWNWAPRTGKRFVYDCKDGEWSGNIVNWLKNNIYSN